MKKTIAELIDELGVTNNKIFALVDKVKCPNGTIEDARKLQSLNDHRAKLMNAINEELGEKERRIKV